MMAKVKRVVRREYTKADVKELRAHSRVRTPVAKLTKRSVGSLRQKARKLGIPLAQEVQYLWQCGNCKNEFFTVVTSDEKEPPVTEITERFFTSLLV
jgi:hypothetical protein